MTEEILPSPEAKIVLPLNGVDYELVPTQKFTFAETRELKRISGGMPLVELERGLTLADADAWFAWIFVSVKRAYPKLTSDELERAIGDLSVVDIIELIKETSPDAELLPFPGAPASPNGSPEANGSEEPGAKIPLPLTPEAPGGLS